MDVEPVDATAEQTLWAEHFDRKLADVMAVQSEAAGRFADALQAKLTTGEQREIAKRLTDNMAAYDLFLRARRVAGTRDGK